MPMGKEIEFSCEKGKEEDPGKSEHLKPKYLF